MEKEASDELIRIKGHVPYFIVSLSAPVGKGDLTV